MDFLQYVVEPLSAMISESCYLHYKRRYRIRNGFNIIIWYFYEYFKNYAQSTSILNIISNFVKGLLRVVLEQISSY